MKSAVKPMRKKIHCSYHICLFRYLLSPKQRTYTIVARIRLFRIKVYMILIKKASAFLAIFAKICFFLSSLSDFSFSPL